MNTPRKTTKTEAAGRRRNRLIFIGLDGSEPDLVKQWAGEGKLPTFQRLLGTGAKIPLESPWGLGSGAMWPSISTSLNPGNNGMYFFRHLVPGTYRTSPADETQISGTPFWEAVSRDGKRVIVLDVPKARLPDDLNGLIVCDWLGHGEVYSEPVSFPESLIDEIIRLYGKNPTGPCDITGRTPDEYVKFVDDLKHRVDMKKSLTLDLMAKEEWDLFVTSFAEAHCVGHHCWHLHDADYIGYDSDTAGHTGDPLLKIYAALDSALAEILAAAPDNTRIMLLLGPGMGPNYNGERSLEDVLRRLAGIPIPVSRKSLGKVKSIWRKLPVAVRRRLSHVAERIDEGSQESDRAIRRFFAIPGNHSHAAIRINVKGRDPNGLVAPGEEYDKVCAELTSALRELVNLDTGKPVFTEIRRAVDLFHGSRADILPDIMAEWDRTGPITRVFSERIGSVESEFREFRSGDHTMHCELIVQNGNLPRHIGNSPRPTEDVGTTIAKLLNSEIPASDGEAIDALFPGHFDVAKQS